jgi:exodeoxyribonuclease VII small subunit
MAKAELTYSKAFARLQEIVAEIEDGEIDVDALTASVKEATGLVAFCRSRLTTTQREIAQALEDVETAAQPAGTAASPTRPEEDDPFGDEEQRAEAASPAPHATPASQKSRATTRRQSALADTDEFDPFANI